MREGWLETSLGELTSKRADFTAVDHSAEYTILGVQRSGWGFVRRDPIKGSEQKFTKLMKVDKDDLVYRTITAFEAPSAVAGAAEAGLFVTPQTFPVFRIDRRRLMPTYMHLLTTWPKFHEAMATRCTGSVLRRKTLSVSAFQSIPVSLPPLAEQRRIVDLIGAVDDAIEAAVEEAANATRLLTERLSSFFASPPSTIPFEDAATFASGFAFPVGSQGESGGTIPFIKVSDMNLVGNEREIVSANNYVTEQTLRKLKARTWPAGAVVFPKVGAALLTEKRRILTTDTAFDNNVMGVIARPGVLRPEFLFAFMRTVRLGEYAQTGALPSVNQGHLKQLVVPAVSLSEQDAFTAEIGDMDNAIHRVEHHVSRMRDLRSNLLTALLSGEHEIPSSYDELIS